MTSSQRQHKDNKGSPVVASNRRAGRDFEILETFEAGIVLVGSEVKSVRENKVEIAEAYAQIRRGEVWVLGMNIPTYAQSAAAFREEPDRPRKLLLHRKEIERLRKKIEQQPLTLIVLSLHFSGKNAKVELALARRKRKYDKRQQIAERDAAQDTKRYRAQDTKRGAARQKTV